MHKQIIQAKKYQLFDWNTDFIKLTSMYVNQVAAGSPDGTVALCKLKRLNIKVWIFGSYSSIKKA